MVGFGGFLGINGGLTYFVPRLARVSPGRSTVVGVEGTPRATPLGDRRPRGSGSEGRLYRLDQGTGRVTDVLLNPRLLRSPGPPRSYSPTVDETFSASVLFLLGGSPADHQPLGPYRPRTGVPRVGRQRGVRSNRSGRTVEGSVPCGRVGPRLPPPDTHCVSGDGTPWFGTAGRGVRWGGGVGDTKAGFAPFCDLRAACRTATTGLAGSLPSDGRTETPPLTTCPG